MNDLARLDRLIVWTALIVFAVLVACFWPAGFNEGVDMQDFKARKQLDLIENAMFLYTDGGPIPGDLTFVAKVYSSDSTQISDILRTRGFSLNTAVIGQPVRSVPADRWLAESRMVDVDGGS